MSGGPPSGAMALWALVQSAQANGAAPSAARAGARAAVQALLRDHGGNATRAARALGLARSAPLLALVDALELRGWLDATWPGRSSGGRVNFPG